MLLADKTHTDHRCTQDFTIEGVHRGGSGIFQKGLSQEVSGMENPQWVQEQGPIGVWGKKLKQ